MDSRASSDIDRVLRELAETQLGLVTAAQAARAGIAAQRLAHRRSVGMLVSVFPGVMRLGGLEPPPLQRLFAAALAVPGSCVAGPSAASIHGLPVPSPRTGEPVVLSVERPTVVRISGIRAVRLGTQLPGRCFTPPGSRLGVQVATPSATLVLLARFVTAATLERCLDHCLVNRLVTVATVRKLIESVPGQAVGGRRLLLDLLDDRATGSGHRSKIEQRVARWLTDAGLRCWRRNFVVLSPDGQKVEVDFAWPECKIALEVSPFFTHGAAAELGALSPP